MLLGSKRKEINFSVTKMLAEQRISGLKMKQIDMLRLVSVTILF